MQKRKGWPLPPPSIDLALARYKAILTESRPKLSRPEWVAVLSVMGDTEVDPALWPRPGEYIGTKVLMDLDPLLRRSLSLDEDFELRLSHLSSPEGWAMVSLVESYWNSPAKWASMDDYLASEGIC